MIKRLTIVPLLILLASCTVTFTLSINPNKLSIKQGGFATLEINVKQEGGLRTIPVRVTLKNPPPGVTAESVLYHYEKILTIKVSDTAQIGTFQIEVVQDQSGSINTNLELTILPK